jgi:hypothetical protein
MFTLLKVRADQKPGDYKDPGWYAMPPGTQSREVAASSASPVASAKPAATSTPNPQSPPTVSATVRKPTGSGGHAH